LISTPNERLVDVVRETSRMRVNIRCVSKKEKQKNYRIYKNKYENVNKLTFFDKFLEKIYAIHKM